jgi:hypothetical protein
MTHDPHLPTLEQIMNNNPFELVDTPWGHIEAWRASTLATGTMGALAQVYDVVRNDAAEVAARANEIEARKGLVQHLCDQIAEMQQRINTLADALEARHKADAEREEQERQFEEEPLSEPPGTDTELEAQDPPEIVADLEVGSHVPGGELHDIPPKDEGGFQEPPLETEDDAGGVPLSYGNVPTSYVRGRGPKDQAGELPEELEDLPVPPEPTGRAYPQPIAVSLNEE